MSAEPSLASGEGKGQDQEAQREAGFEQEIAAAYAGDGDGLGEAEKVEGGAQGLESRVAEVVREEKDGLATEKEQVEADGTPEQQQGTLGETLNAAAAGESVSLDAGRPVMDGLATAQDASDVPQQEQGGASSQDGLSAVPDGSTAPSLDALAPAVAEAVSSAEVEAEQAGTKAEALDLGAASGEATISSASIATASTVTGTSTGSTAPALVSEATTVARASSPAGLAPLKKFTSLNVNKRFLEKTGPATSSIAPLATKRNVTGSAPAIGTFHTCPLLTFAVDRESLTLSLSFLLRFFSFFQVALTRLLQRRV